MTRLTYIPGSSIIPPDAFSISPSSLGKFFDSPQTWYTEHVLGKRTFDSTTSTILGTITHFCGEDYLLNRTVDKLEIFKYLFETLYPDQPIPFDSLSAAEAFFATATHPTVDIPYILSQYKPMGNCLISYLSALPKHRLSIAKPEQMVAAEIITNYYVAGSCDLTIGDELFDYKTTSSLSAPSHITFGYRLQLLAYAYANIQSGTPIRQASIIWITNHQVNRTNTKGKPLEDYPATCSRSSIITIDDESLRYIEDILKLVAETVQFVKANPQYAYIAFKDYRLKLSEIPHIPFKKETKCQP